MDKPNILVRADEWIENTIFMPIAKLWQRVTGTAPTRLAWYCLIFFAVAVVAPVSAILTDPHVSSTAKIRISITTGLILAMTWVMLEVLNKVEGGIRLAARGPFFYLLVVLRLAITVLAARAVLLILISGFSPITLVVYDLGAILLWAGYYLMNIHLPPQWMESKSMVKAKS